MNCSKSVSLVFAALVFIAVFGCKGNLVPADRHQASQDAYCAQRGKSTLNGDTKLSRLEAFYSWKIHTCVQVEVDTSSPNWSYALRDVSAGFFQPPKLVHAETSLTISHDERFGMAYTTGYWVATDSDPGKQLASTIVADIRCDKSEHVCRESDATLFIGLLQPQTQEFEITSWTSHGIVADDESNSTCGMNHRLSINFDAPSAVLTDYPNNVGDIKTCKSLQAANSYSLHGGSIAMVGQNQIFYCDKDGADSAIIAKVEKLNGDVESQKYADWLDNEEGGPARTNKTPEHPYTQEKCSALMDKKLAELRQD